MGQILTPHSHFPLVFDFNDSSCQADTKQWSKEGCKPPLGDFYAEEGRNLDAFFKHYILVPVGGENVLKI